jgi:hypothetical protein
LDVLEWNIQSLTEQIVTNQNQKKRLVDGLAGSETGIGAVLGRFPSNKTI